jgi:hypothetical protein
VASTGTRTRPARRAAAVPIVSRRSGAAPATRAARTAGTSTARQAPRLGAHGDLPAFHHPAHVVVELRGTPRQRSRGNAEQRLHDGRLGAVAIRSRLATAGPRAAHTPAEWTRAASRAPSAAAPGGARSTACRQRTNPRRTGRWPNTRSWITLIAAAAATISSSSPKVSDTIAPTVADSRWTAASASPKGAVRADAGGHERVRQLEQDGARPARDDDALLIDPPGHAPGSGAAHRPRARASASRAPIAAACPQTPGSLGGTSSPPRRGAQ